ncbi:MAG: alpha/beta fold hydrolase [Bacteroidota bacterium]
MKSSSRSFRLILAFLVSLIFTQSQAQEPADITIHRGDIPLKGKFYETEGTGVFPTVILLHGFPGNDKDILDIGRKLPEAGINALTFNYSGTHQSEGLFNFENSQKDIKAAFEFIYHSGNISKYKIDTNHVYLGGYSYGGGMALTYAANHPETQSVFSIAGNDHGAFIKEYNHNPEVRDMIDKMFDDLKNQPEIVRFGPGGTPEAMAEMEIIKLNPTYDLRYCAPMLAQKNILLIGAWDDVNVSIENVVLPLYRALKNEKAKNVKITAVQDDHSFRNSREELAQIIIEWIKTTSERNKY